jgi:hypothetical protein
MLNSTVLSAVRPQLSRRNHALVLKDCRELCIVKFSFFPLQAVSTYEYRRLDQALHNRPPSKRPVRDIWL